MNVTARTLAHAGLGAALSVALLATPYVAHAQEAPSASSGTAAATAASDETAESVLFIGRDGATAEVPCTAEATPEALVAALAEETGWNLDLAGDIAVDDAQGVTIPLAQDSVIYTGSMEGVGDAYAIEDREELVYTVLNSIATTIWNNTPYSFVYFCAPDGGAIEIEDGAFSFYLSNYADWYEPNIQTSNGPLPADSLGRCWLTPSGPTTAGWPSLNLVFVRDGVEPGEGAVSILDSDGTVVEEIDVSDPERVHTYEPAEEARGYYNLKGGSFITVELNETLEPNETYEVRFNKEAFVCGDLTASRDITDGMWQIETYGFGLGETSEPDFHVTLGESFTEEYLLDDSVEKVAITFSDPEAFEVSATELTESGTVTFTPLKTGNLYFLVTFYLTDGTVCQFGNDYTVDEA